MQSVLEIVLSNSAIATLLAAIAMVAGRYCRRPTLLCGLWLLVLVKLVTPPLVRIPFGFLGEFAIAEPQVTREPKPALEPAAQVDPASNSADRSTGYNSHSPAAEQRRLDDNPDPATTSAIDQSAGQPVNPEARAAPLASTAEPIPSTDRAVAGSTFAASPPSKARLPWLSIVLGVWLAGSVVWFSLTLIRIARFCREINRPWPSDDRLQQRADGLARRFGLSRSPKVKLINAAVPPMLWAMRRPPEIYLPRGLIERLSPEQTQTLLAHELAHFRRNDHWVRWLEVLILGIYWWHPIAWIARRQLQRSEEQCCDAWVLWALPNAASIYARTILETVDFLTTDNRPSPALASGLGPVHVLERRFEMILHTRPAHRAGILAKSGLMLVALLVLSLSAKAQVAPPETRAAPAAESAPAATTAAPAAEPTTPAGVGPEVPQDAGKTVAPPTISAGGPAPANVLNGISAGQSSSQLYTPAPQSVFTPPVAAGALDQNQNDTERRLKRLEDMMQMLLAQTQGQHRSDRQALFLNKIGSTSAAGGGNVAVSLSDLKKQRIDLEDELDSIQERMAKVDEQIAKLQSAHSPKAPVPTNQQAR